MFEYYEEEEEKAEEMHTLKLFEIGSGTGNTVFPLLKIYNEERNYIQSKLFVYAWDLSKTAVDLINSQLNINWIAFQKNFVWDPITEIEDKTLNFITMIFFLSAVHPDYFDKTLEKAKKLLSTERSSYILFRDYGAYDLAMLRFLKK